MRLQRSPLLVLLVLLAMSSLAGCSPRQPAGTQTAASSSPTPPANTSSVGDGPAPTVSLSNPSPGQLTVEVSITIGSYDPNAGEMTTVALGFQSGDKVVQFTGNERLTCSGTDLPVHDRAAIFQVADGPTAALEGRAIKCTYSAGGVSATIVLTIPRAPAILAPHAEAQVQRAAKTLITYQAFGGQLLGIVALGPNNKALAQLNTPGPGQAIVDTSAFQAGPGTLALTQALDVPLTQTGAAFAAVQTNGQAEVAVTITWI